MAIEPVVGFYNRETNIDLSVEGWTVGTVKADTESEVLPLRVWNNKGGEELASTMQDCELYILDENEVKLQPIVTEGWLKGLCASLGDTEFITIDDQTVLNIGSSESDTSNYDIFGDINDGEDTNIRNFADVDLKFAVPFGATHGQKGFSVAVKYFYT
ncbi:hypothetical protein [Halalkalibacter oceani]|uniref:hypothetical protein n=1 Tax=Halalkalibacter oceani TaxID=1653776 RepID=UPI003391C594